VTTTADRAEINRRNASRSTGPRSPEGRARSRFDAVKHGCRARLPILPGEDPEDHRRRRDAWVDKFAPRDAVETYLVERAVDVSWRLDRADRAELARLAAELDAEAARRAREVAELAARRASTTALDGGPGHQLTAGGHQPASAWALSASPQTRSPTLAPPTRRGYDDRTRKARLNTGPSRGCCRDRR
jgi:hypothetical protein